MVLIPDDMFWLACGHVTNDLSSKPALTTEEISERMSGNLCRCAAYPNIVKAIRKAAGGNA